MTDPRQIEFLPLTDLQEDPENPKRHDMNIINDSIGRFGLLDAIVRDDRTGYIISGHGRKRTLEAMQERGENPPEGVRTDKDGGWLVPVVTGWQSRSDTEAKAALIALNRTTELGAWNDEALLDILSDLSEIDNGLVGVGYTDDDIDALTFLTDTFEDTGPRDLDDLYDEIGDPEHTEAMVRVIINLPPDLASPFQEWLGEDPITTIRNLLEL